MHYPDRLKLGQRQVREYDRKWWRIHHWASCELFCYSGLTAGQFKHLLFEMRNSQIAKCLRDFYFVSGLNRKWKAWHICMVMYILRRPLVLTVVEMSAPMWFYLNNRSQFINHSLFVRVAVVARTSKITKSTKVISLIIFKSILKCLSTIWHDFTSNRKCV